MITITYRVCFDYPSIFRTYKQMSHNLDLENPFLQINTYQSEGFMLSIMAIEVNGNSVRLQSLTNPLTQLREAGKL